jgi:hypothetical protein
MSVVALVSWLATAFLGLYLLVIWLIEYDPEFQSVAATRLPVPVISAHVLLALSGLVTWAIYLITGQERIARIAAVILIVVALLGVTMAVRWFGVRKERVAAARAPADAGAGRAPVQLATSPERNFPLPVVVGHGIFAAITIVLVLLTVLGIGQS